jgi:hypothetical protein
MDVSFTIRAMLCNVSFKYKYKSTYIAYWVIKIVVPFVTHAHTCIFFLISKMGKLYTAKLTIFVHLDMHTFSTFVSLMNKEGKGNMDRPLFLSFTEIGCQYREVTWIRKNIGFLSPVCLLECLPYFFLYLKQVLI